jgi:hypothetical protein
VQARQRIGPLLSLEVQYFVSIGAEVHGILTSFF